MTNKKWSFMRTLAVGARDGHTHKTRILLKRVTQLVTRTVMNNNLNFWVKQNCTPSLGVSYNWSKIRYLLHWVENTISCLPVFEINPQKSWNINNKLSRIFRLPHVWLFLSSSHCHLFISSNFLWYSCNMTISEKEWSLIYSQVMLKALVLYQIIEVKMHWPCSLLRWVTT